MKVSVFVAGHRGMLGHVAVRYFAEKGCRVITSERRYQALARDPLVEEIRDSQCGWVVNALGKIKQKCQEPDDLFRANSLFPIQLKKRLRRDQRLICASTDCVFSGRAGNYSIDSEPDPEDIYGLSKLLGETVAEPDRAYVLRSSIIGPELTNGVGLMSWFLRQEGSVKGFANHLWNGITTLEWSKACLELMRGERSLQTSLWQVGVWPPVSKYDLLHIVANVWGHPVSIEAVNAPRDVDRSLRPTWLRGATLPEQILELKEWYVSDDDS
jgi:dTDP-4-dehydrorhamnose reductase